jgi:hypothetical protein
MKHVIAWTLILGFAALAWASPDEATWELQPRDLDVLPIHDVEWAILARDNPKVVGPLIHLGKRIEKIYGNLVARKNQADGGAVALRGEIARTGERMAELFRDLSPSLEKLGIRPEVLAATREAPAGPLRPLRHAIRLVAQAPLIDPAIARLHDRLGASVEGALLALEHEREAAEAADDVEGLQRIAGRMRGLEVRYWQVADATLDRPQRTWLRRRLPSELAKLDNLLEHVFLLPELTPSQFARLKSLLVGLDASLAPDRAAAARADADTEKREAEYRLVGRAADAWESGLRILRPEQTAVLMALPPRLTAKERVGELKAVLAAVELTPGQVEKARALHRRYGPVKGRLVEEVAAIELRTRDEASDSPMRDLAEAERTIAYARALAQGRAAAREVFRDLLSSDQILLWVLDTPKR